VCPYKRAWEEISWGTRKKKNTLNVVHSKVRFEGRTTTLDDNSKRRPLVKDGFWHSGGHTQATKKEGKTKKIRNPKEGSSL